jgi:acyl-CoA dehydrogenase-like protein
MTAAASAGLSVESLIPVLGQQIRVNVRKGNGVPLVLCNGIGASLEVHDPLGKITSSWALCTRLSQLQDEGRAEDRHSSLAKAWCTVRMRETVGYAREILDGNGIVLEHNVGRLVADAEAIYSYDGTREMNTLIVGRAITGLSAFV